MDGRAKLSTVASTATSNTGSSRTASAIHSRVPALGATVVAGVVRPARSAPVWMVRDMVLSPEVAGTYNYTDQLV